MAASDPAMDGGLTVLVMGCAAGILAGQTTVTFSTKTGLPRRFPRCELLSVGTDGSRNYAVCPVKVMAWVHKRMVIVKGSTQTGRAQ